jgi:hypothetical protein
MSKITIRTNHKPRPVLQRYELTEKESAEFDYLAPDEGSFFRYKGQVYDLGEFSRVIVPGAERMHPMECDNPGFAGWDGYASDSFFSGMLVKYTDGFESVIVAQYFS